LVAVTLVLAGCGSASPADAPSNRADGSTARPNGTVTVLAAASLTEAFDKIARDFERSHPGTTVRLSFGGSSALATQVINGAPADVLATADLATMRRVAEADGGTRLAQQPTIFATNRLQIAVPPDNPGRVAGLAHFARPELRLAVCAPQVPCGRAAAEAFRRAGVIPRPDTYGPDVKAVLTLVRTGEVDAGLVYLTDVCAAGDAVRGLDLPEATSPVHDYPIAVLADAPNPTAARAFVDHVHSAAGRQRLTEACFEVP
jgi:molybdate transport system substrate-binding protein